jgi:SAM-dependent methyltransferase
VIDGDFISLLPERLSENNAREAGCFELEHEDTVNYMIAKPAMYPRIMREHYESGCAEIGASYRDLAAKLGREPSTLFVFAAGGMEVHLSGFLGPNVVLADISLAGLKMADLRFAHHGVPKPGAYIACDAERLPFASASFDFVVAFEGIHHCLIPQSALYEVCRVAKHRVFIADNYESGLTRLMGHFGRSSVVEYSGTKPNRFSWTALETLLFNAGIQNYRFRGIASLPPSISDRLGYRASRLIERALELCGQQNQFVLIVDRD